MVKGRAQQNDRPCWPWENCHLNISENAAFEKRHKKEESKQFKSILEGTEDTEGEAEPEGVEEQQGVPYGMRRARGSTGGAPVRMSLPQEGPQVLFGGDSKPPEGLEHSDVIGVDINRILPAIGKHINQIFSNSPHRRHW